MPTLATAVIGDVGGHADALTAALSALGANVPAGTLPDGLHVVQVGDLVHRGPDSMAVLALVDRFLTHSPHQWTQLLGNHEAQYLQPGGPAFSWPQVLPDEGQDLLRKWWDGGQLTVAAAIPTAGPGTLATHAGLTPGFARALNSDRRLADAADAATQLNELSHTASSPLWWPGRMLTGSISPIAGPLWAEAATELYTPWWQACAAGAMPFDQVHGHAQMFDFNHSRNGTNAWRHELMRNFARVDIAARHVRVQLGERTITGLDPCHGKKPAPSWAPLILAHQP